VHICLQALPCHNYFRRKAQGIAGSMPKIDQQIVEQALIPLPPAQEQKAIVEAVEGQLSVIDHIESDVTTKLNSARSLRQSILCHAFTGQLVPQDPNDEPAFELLKRIAAERDARQRAAAGTTESTSTRRPAPRPGKTPAGAK